MTEPCPVLLPASYPEAARMMAEYAGEARILGGGQSLSLLMRMGMVEPAALISLRRCPEATTATPVEGALRIGARFTVTDTAGLGYGYLAVADAAAQVASPHVRNIGSVVGNVCHADPANDMAVPLLCHGARVVLVSESGERECPIAEFLTGPYETAVGDEEFARELRVPALPGWRGAYRKIVWRSADHPVSGVAAALRTQAGVVTGARFALGGALGTPRLLPEVAAAVIGLPVAQAPAAARAAAADLLSGLPVLGEGEDDMPAAYRRKVSVVLAGDAAAAALGVNERSER